MNVPRAQVLGVLLLALLAMLYLIVRYWNVLG